MTHLDTSFLIRALKVGTPEDRKLREWIGKGESLAMCTIAWGEFLCGPLSRHEFELADAIIGPRRDFTSEHAAVAARIFNESGRRRGSLIDCMIAAVALTDGDPIATTNTSDFRRFEDSGLKMA